MGTRTSVAIIRAKRKFPITEITKLPHSSLYLVNADIFRSTFTPFLARETSDYNLTDNLTLPRYLCRVSIYNWFSIRAAFN